MSNRQTINMLIKLSVIADESAAIAKSDKEALKSATEQAYTDIADDILGTMVTGATYTDAARIARDTLDEQCNDVIFAALQANEIAFGDLGKLIRKADKLASRLMACAYTVVMSAPDGKINKLETFAAHMRKGYPLCRVSHMGLPARLSDSPDVTRSNAAKVDPNEERIAALLAANEAMAMELEAAKAALQAVVHGGEIIGNMGQKKGRQRSKVA